MKGILTDKEKLPILNKPSETGGLRDYVLLAVGARVLLTKNIDVGDGHTCQCKRTGGCYNELVVAFFSTGGGVKGKKIYTH